MEKTLIGVLGVLLVAMLYARIHWQGRAIRAERELARTEGQLASEKGYSEALETHMAALRDRHDSLVDRITQMQREGMVWVDQGSGEEDRSWSARDADRARMSP